MPAEVEDLRARLEEYAWGEELLRRATPGALMSDGGEGRAADAPPLEVVPFGATVPSSAITAFAIALVARDGLLALLSLALTIGGGYFVLKLVG